MKRALTLSLALMSLSGSALAQQRQPLCTTVESRRIASAGRVADAQDALVARPLLGRSTDGARFIVAWRESRAAGTGTTLGFARVNESMRRVGPVIYRVNPEAPNDLGDGAISSVSLSAGVLVLFRAGNSVYSILAGNDGAPGAPTRVFEGPSAQRRPGGLEARASNAMIVYTTIIARGDGAVALIGMSDGSVVGMRFDRNGAVQGSTAQWAQRVGGAMRLLPTEGGPIAGFLARPLPGVGPSGETPAVQMLVTLGDDLLPSGTPERTGFAQFPWTSVARRGGVSVMQWAGSQGLAVATLPLSARRVGVESPRQWYAQPPMQGSLLATEAIVRDGITYNVAAFDADRAALDVSLAWISPAGEPAICRSVVPSSGALVSTLGLLPAQDGVVVLAAVNDETGFGVDAHHVRCDLVSR